MWLCRCLGTKFPSVFSWIYVCSLLCPAQESSPGTLDADRAISIQVDGEPLTVTTTTRLAGAVHSLQWRGREFIDSTDHGRQLQSACSFDAMSDDEFWAERYNPTEAGSRIDAKGPRSSSRLLGIQSSSKEIRTSTKMAFWLNPGERSQGRLALNKSIVSDHILHKRIKLGAYASPHVILWENTFERPESESHRFAQYEVLTGYMPSEFSEFWRVSAADGRLARLDDGPGEQSDPVILATVDGRFAMGAVSIGKPKWMQTAPGYGRFRFTEEKVVKWNVVFRHSQYPRIVEHQASFRVLVMVGSLEKVRSLIWDAISGELVQID